MKIILMTMMLLISAPVYAAADKPDLYQINVIVFEHITAQGLQAEQWPAITDMPDLARAVDPELLPPEMSQLKVENRRLHRKIAQQKNYKVLLNISWQQKIPVSKHAKPIHITGNKIDGTITITRDHYFNIQTNLILTEPADYLDNIGKGNYAANITNNSYKSFQMAETCRMRSNELNYLDHPLFGMLIKIMPV